MRIAFIATIQGNLAAMRAVLDAIDNLEEPVDRIVCAGDVVGRGPYPNEVIELLTEREIETVRGNYDDAVAFGRDSSGVDFPDEATEQADLEALNWTQRELTPENRQFLLDLPNDVRLSPRGAAVRVQRDIGDARVQEYKKSFFVRALAGGLVRQQTRMVKQAVVFHGSPRALNELLRESTATSILGTIAHDVDAEVLITAHSESSFRRDAHGIAWVGVGPVSRAGSSVAEFVVLDIRREIVADFLSVPYDRAEHDAAMRRTGLIERPIYPIYM